MNPRLMFTLSCNPATRGEPIIRARPIIALTLLLFAFLVIPVAFAGASTQKVLYTFTGGTDGGQPFAGVIFDKAGNLYGVTQTGGLYGKGTVFQLSPSENGWTENVLYSFTGGADGGQPVGGLVMDDLGYYLYGTTASGGDPVESCGTVFQLEGSSLNVLYTFKGYGVSDGCNPVTKLYYIDYALWGTTLWGGSHYDAGTAFFLDTERDYWRAPLAYAQGQRPWGGMNEWGYGTTNWGGYGKWQGVGNIFHVNWGVRAKNVHAFNSIKDKAGVGYYPLGELLTATVNGVRTMYGTNSAGGLGSHGTVYRLTETPRGAWKLTALHWFAGQDGDGPGAGLVSDAAGNLYGTTTYGGTDPGYAGTVFKLSPGAPKKPWVYTLLYSFSGGNDGGEVTSGVVRDASGNLYGTTLSGGAYNKWCRLRNRSVTNTTRRLPVARHELSRRSELHISHSLLPGDEWDRQRENPPLFLLLLPSGSFHVPLLSL